MSESNSSKNDKIESKSSTKNLSNINNKQVSEHQRHDHSQSNIWLLALGALGVVYGDIGTSPLYALKECFSKTHGVPLTEANILGVLSLAFWSLVMVVTVKYISFVMKADNHGEGGIFSLLALVPSSAKDRNNMFQSLKEGNPIEEKFISTKLRAFVVFSALLGASLLYGDGVITPAISVLSAIEGLELATEAAKPFTVPITCVILFLLFSFQKYGTAKIGVVFGPIMIVWFSLLAFLGFTNLISNPSILWAINPFYAYQFFILNQFHAFIVLGSVVLCITGGEALYADMGHFGRKPIQLSWLLFVFPALILNYFGQGALLLKMPEAVENPFFSLVPKLLVIPMVILSTCATIIASQALISGAFSLTRQAIQLGFMPRLNIVHTSESSEGQIYIPFINKLLMILCILLVLVFKSSENLAAAYGLAVTANMILTSFVFYIVTTKTWNWSVSKALPLILFFLAFDSLYFLSNLIKFLDGGWLPCAMALFVLNIMLIWKDGRALLGQKIKEDKRMAAQNLSALSVEGTAQLLESYNQGDESVPIDVLIKESFSVPPQRVSGTAVFMAVKLKGFPPVFLQHIKHNQVLHEKVIFLSIKSLDVPVVRNNKVDVKEVGFGFYNVRAFYGFMETPNVLDIMRRVKEDFNINIEIETTTFYLGRETLISSDKKKGKMPKWRKNIFAFLSRNSLNATAYFNIPPHRVVEMGLQIEL
ncbi:MAG: potassium uptake protein [Candidatus Sericytochromatia bacterium]